MKALHWMDRYRKEVLQLSTRKHGINVQYLYDTCTYIPTQQERCRHPVREPPKTHGALVLFFNYLCPEFFFFQFKNIQNENRPLDPRLLLPGCSHCLWLRWQTSRRSFCFWSVDQRSTNMCCCQGSSRYDDSCKYLQVAPIEIVVNLELAYSKKTWNLGNY